MKRSAVLALMAVALAFLAAPVLAVESKDDLQAIKKAVKENPAYEPGKEVKWFKILVTDNRTGKDKVKITLPISVVELFLRCADDKHLKMHREECDIDIEAVFKELKAMGPMAIIEINEEDETVKVWFE
ncbi:MAG: hypothetical protein AB1715_05305 [Acidobacteriota bacterium]